MGSRPATREVGVRAVTWQGVEDVRVEDVPDARIEEPTDAIVEPLDDASTAYANFQAKQDETIKVVLQP
jgi:threonine dehydrogenase-like Zn-dependent dehydrogenase